MVKIIAVFLKFFLIKKTFPSCFKCFCFVCLFCCFCLAVEEKWKTTSSVFSSGGGSGRLHQECLAVEEKWKTTSSVFSSGGEVEDYIKCV